MPSENVKDYQTVQKLVWACAGWDVNPKWFHSRSCEQLSFSILSLSILEVHQGVCSTQGDVQYTRGISLSTPWGVQYAGGISWVHWGLLSTVRDVMSTLGGDHDGYGGYHEYSGGVQYTGGYHEYTGGDTMMRTPGFPYKLIVSPMTFPHIYPEFLPGVLNAPSVLMISPHCTHDIPRCTEHPPLFCTPPVYCTYIMQGALKRT